MKRLLFALCLLCVPVLASAQTVANPNTFDVPASPQHSDVNPIDGLSVVVSYDILIYLQTGAISPTQTFNCGKPTPVAGKFSCTIPQTVKDALAKNTLYVAKQRVNGQAGTSAVSASGGPFGYEGPVVLTVGGPPEPKQ